MKKFMSRLTLSFLAILGSSGKVFGGTVSNMGPTAGLPPIIEPQNTLISLVDRVLHWMFLPLVLIALVFYSLYIYQKHRKKGKKRYLYVSNISIILLIIILAVWFIFDFLGETNHMEWVTDIFS